MWRPIVVEKIDYWLYPLKSRFYLVYNGIQNPENTSFLLVTTATSSSWPTYLATPPGPFKRQKEGDKICDLLDDLPIGYFELPEMISRRCGPQRSKRLRIPRERRDFW